MNVDLKNIFFEEIRVFFRSCHLRKNRKGDIIDTILNNKGFPFPKIFSFLDLLFGNSKLLIVVKEVWEGLDEMCHLIVFLLNPIGFE